MTGGNGRAPRFGSSATTHSLPTRLLLTLPFLALAVGSLVSGLRAESAAERLPGMFGIVVSGYAAFVLLPHVWRTSDAYIASTWRAHRLERRLEEELRGRELPAIGTWEPDPADATRMAVGPPAPPAPGPTVSEVRRDPRARAVPRPATRFGSSVTGLTVTARVALSVVIVIVPVLFLLQAVTAPGMAKVLALTAAVLFSGPAYLLLPGIWRVNDSWSSSQWRGRTLERELHRELHGDEGSVHSRLSVQHHGANGMPRRW